MKNFYSPSTGGFYNDILHENSMPSDIIELDENLYKNLLENLALGHPIGIDENNIPFSLPVPEPLAYVPNSVTRAQGKMVLVETGLWPVIQNYIETITDPINKVKAEIAMNDTVYWYRSSPFLNQVVVELGIDQEQLDALFIAAAKIEL